MFMSHTVSLVLACPSTGNLANAVAAGNVNLPTGILWGPHRALRVIYSHAFNACRHHHATDDGAHSKSRAQYRIAQLYTLCRARVVDATLMFQMFWIKNDSTGSPTETVTLCNDPSEQDG